VKGRALVLGAVLLAALGGLGFLLLGNQGDDDASDEAPTTTAVELPPSGTRAPLTGLPVADEDLDLLARPALAAKVDNHPDALPQWGLSDADVVVELRVEGISRFLAVFHSRDVGDVGPIRSARTSDPDLLAVFGRPLAAWSGANPSTRELMRGIEWIQDVSADRLPDAYRRDDWARAPHNLVLDAADAYGVVEDPVRLPRQLFEYLGDGDGDAPGGEPVAGFELHVGLSRAAYRWDGERGGWLRWSDGTPLHDASHGGAEGPQVAPANVVVLETAYGVSPTDASSPEAITLGEGRAWVFTGGHLVSGRWSRQDRTAPWALVAEDGTPIRLTPGSTWVAMPAEGAEPQTLTAERAAALGD
jgi:hypothetical protein